MTFEYQDANMVVFNMTLFKHVCTTLIDSTSKMTSSLPDVPHLTFQSFPRENSVVWKQHYIASGYCGQPSEPTKLGSLCILDLNTLTRTYLWGEKHFNWRALGHYGDTVGVKVCISHKNAPEYTHQHRETRLDINMIGYHENKPNVVYVFVDVRPCQVWKIHMSTDESALLWTYEEKHDLSWNLMTRFFDYETILPVIHGDRIMILFFDCGNVTPDVVHGTTMLLELNVNTLDKVEITQTEIPWPISIKRHQIFTDASNNPHYLLTGAPDINTDVNEIFWEYIPGKKQDLMKSIYEFHNYDMCIPRSPGSTSIGSYRWRGSQVILTFEDFIGTFKWKSQWDYAKNVQAFHWEPASNNREIYIVGYAPQDAFWNITVVKYIALPKIPQREMDLWFHFH
jgi:hypothetical protein